MKTPFYELAEKYAKRTNQYEGICANLCEIGGEFDEYFTKMFEPSRKEREEYQHTIWWWMEGITTTEKQNRNLRITALLFADLLWQDEMKGKKK
jgi:hypothetical protein